MNSEKRSLNAKRFDEKSGGYKFPLAGQRIIATRTKLCIAFCVLCGLSSRRPAQAQVAWPPESPKIEQNDEFLGGFVFSRINSVVANDPIRDFAPSFNEGGRLVYCACWQAQTGSYSSWFFVFRDQLSEKQAKANPIAVPEVSTYQWNSNGNFYWNPQFSPDAQSLMFQGGSPNSHIAHSPCYWDFAGRTIHHLDFYTGSPNVRFSQDNRFIGLYAGDDSNSIWEDPQLAPLYAKNIHNGKLFPISAQESITSWSWTSAGKILYSRPLTQPQTNDAHETYQAAYDSQIREYDLNSGADKPVLEHGGAPFPSPNNRYIAFVRTLPLAEVEQTALKPNRLNRAQLSLYDRQTKQIVFLEPASLLTQKGLTCTWSADSKTLVVTRFSETSQGRICSIKTLALESLHMGASQKRVISEVAWKPVLELNMGRLNRFLRTDVKKITRNGRYLILDLSEIAPNVKNYGLNTLDTLEAVDLEKGQIKVLARKVSDIDSSIGWDWIEPATNFAPQAPKLG